jgi:copper chaperone CopZ
VRWRSQLTEPSAERTYSVPAIHCGGCAGTIEEALEPVEGVESASVDLDAKIVRVRGSADDRVLRKVLTAAGYPPA